MINLKNFAYPEGINTPKDMIEYICAVYSIEHSDLLYETIKQICIMSQTAEYEGWFEDYFDEWINKEQN